jgi:hypothetical protein
MKTYTDYIIHIKSKSFLGCQLNDANQEIQSFDYKKFPIENHATSK